MKQQTISTKRFDFDDFSVKLQIATGLVLVALFLAYLAMVK